MFCFVNKQSIAIAFVKMSNTTNGTTPFAPFLKFINDLNRNYTSIPYEEKMEMTVLQRAKLYNWSFELFFIGVVVFIFIVNKVGTSVNVSRADKMFNSVHAFLKDELKFARVGFTAQGSENRLYMDQHLHTWLTSFSTGRSCIEGINVHLHLFPRNNPLSMFLENVMGWYFPILAMDTDAEFCEIEIKPNGVFVGSENANVNSNSNEVLNNFKFISSIVNKAFMNQSRHDNYYLALTHTTEGDDLPNEYVYMSEMNQLNGFITSYCKKDALNNLLNQTVDLLEFISFTDLPADKPENTSVWNATKKIRCVIRTHVPTNEKELVLLNQLIGLVVEIYDNYTRTLVQKNETSFITNDMLKKANNMRTIELGKITKIAREAALGREKEEKKEAEKEKRRNLKKTGEQEKIDQKMKEKRERRQKNKQKVRM